MKRLELANFNLNLLLALDGLLSQRSVTAAAKRVRVTPSAMSHSLAELRHLLGDPLLVRAGRGMVLTPRAEALVAPLHTLLVDVERLLRGGPTFDPATAARRFVIAAPDFLATLLLPPLLDAAAREAPGASLEIVPSARRGNAWLLETGDVDLALGAIVDKAPSIRRMDREAREEAPYRRARVRYFMAAPLVVARSDLLLTGPSMLIRYFAELVPLQVLRPPIDLPTYPEEAYWHERFEEDPAHAWLRNLVKKAARDFGLQERPRKRTW